MKKNEKLLKSGKGTKTFFLYAFMLFLLIATSLIVKSYFIIKHNKFSGESVNIVISKNNKVTGIIGANSEKKTFSLVKIKNANFSPKFLSKNLGIITDGYIDSPNDIINEGTESVFKKLLLSQDAISTDLTIFDKIKLNLLLRQSFANNYSKDEIDYKKTDYESDKILNSQFSDPKIGSENITIQIINATSESGLGKRLERDINNMGGNVISVSSKREESSKSAITYVKQNSYTISRLSKLLDIKPAESSGKFIADIVIIIGNDKKDVL